MAAGLALTAVVAWWVSTRPDLMAQIFADVFARPVRRTRMSDAAGLGAAICAAVGSGVHTDGYTAVRAMATTSDLVTPTAEGIRAYAAIAPAHSRITGFTDPLFATLAATADELSDQPGRSGRTRSVRTTTRPPDPPAATA